MKCLNFKGYSSTEWQEFKRIHREKFWEELEAKQLRDAKIMIQDQIKVEFEMQIGASRYERTPFREDDRNGFRARTLEIKGGLITGLKIPRARDLDIRFTVFDMWQRVQDKVLAAMMKAYILGKSSSSAVEIIEGFGQSKFSRGYLQKLVWNFELRLKRFHSRKIKNYPYVFIDGMAVKVYDTYLKEKIVVFAIGLDNESNKEVLGWVVVDSEDMLAIRSLLIDLKERGLIMPELFITDGSKGIISALKLEYPHTPRQLCAFHKVKNIQDDLIDISHRKDILREAYDIYELSNTKSDALIRFQDFRLRWKEKEPEAIRLFSKNFEDTLRYFDFPEHMRITLRTNNPIEQFIGKLRSWTSKFNYFQGQTNLELAIYTYILYKDGELVPEETYSETETESEVNYQIPTLLFA
jgi:transposase-like protein